MPDVIVRSYGRDSLLLWANLLLAPLLAAFGRRVGLQSDEGLAARMEADAAALRKQGYLVASVETFSVRGLARADAAARWHRVTYERSTPPGESSTTEAGRATRRDIAER